MGVLRRWFSKRIGYPLLVFGRTSRDRRMRALVGEKLRLARMPREQLRQRQLEMLKPLLVHAGTAVPFYRQRFQEAGFDPESVQSLDDLTQIPPLDKDDIRVHLDELVSEDYDRSKLVSLVTGGSTGVPVHLYTDDEAWTHWEASSLIADEYTGWRPGDPFAALWGASFDITPTENVLGMLRKLTRNQLILDTFQLDDAILRRLHRKLTRFRPTVLLGYTSSLLTMADWLERQGIKPAYPTRSIINAAETLLPAQRARLEAAYGAPVFDRYGTRDAGPIAMECEAHEGLHVNVVDLVVEPNGGAPGQPQELLLTNLNGYGMPLIRYRIGDMAVFSDRTCSCGRTTPLFERLVGRVTDMVSLGDASVVPGEFFVHMIKDFPVVEFQLVQEQDGSLTFHIVRKEHYAPEDERRISELIARHAHGLPVRFDYVDQIPRTASGKLRPVISKLAEAGRRDAAERVSN